MCSILRRRGNDTELDFENYPQLPRQKRVVADEMFVPRREVCQDKGCREIVCLIPIVDELLPPSVCRVGDVDGLVRSWEWRITKNKGLDEKVAEHGMQGRG